MAVPSLIAVLLARPADQEDRADSSAPAAAEASANTPQAARAPSIPLAPSPAVPAADPVPLADVLVSASVQASALRALAVSVHHAPEASDPVEALHQPARLLVHSALQPRAAVVAASSTPRPKKAR